MLCISENNITIVHQYKRRIHSPIYLNNVACFGSETKLTECSYHTDTNADKHSEDIWVNCNIEKETSDKSYLREHIKWNFFGSLALLCAAVALCILMIATGLNFVSKCRKKKSKSTTKQKQVPKHNYR